MNSVRKPYIRPVTASWWQKNGFYRFYMLREGTSLGAIWFSLLLLYGLYCLGSGPTAWAGFTSLLSSPLMLLANSLALLAALLHTWTWFGLAPKALHLPARGRQAAVLVLWGVTLAASVATFAVFLAR